MGKSVEYYLAKGYDQKMAEYFASGRKRITKVVPRNDFTLVLSFDNGEIRLCVCEIHHVDRRFADAIAEHEPDG